MTRLSACYCRIAAACQTLVKIVSLWVEIALWRSKEEEEATFETIASSPQFYSRLSPFTNGCKCGLTSTFTYFCLTCFHCPLHMFSEITDFRAYTTDILRSTQLKLPFKKAKVQNGRPQTDPLFPKTSVWALKVKCDHIVIFFQGSFQKAVSFNDQEKRVENMVKYDM